MAGDRHAARRPQPLNQVDDEDGEIRLRPAAGGEACRQCHGPRASRIAPGRHNAAGRLHLVNHRPTLRTALGIGPAIALTPRTVRGGPGIRVREHCGQCSRTLHSTAMPCPRPARAWRWLVSRPWLASTARLMISTARQSGWDAAALSWPWLALVARPTIGPAAVKSDTQPYPAPPPHPHPPPGV